MILPSYHSTSSSQFFPSLQLDPMCCGTFQNNILSKGSHYNTRSTHSSYTLASYLQMCIPNDAVGNNHSFDMVLANAFLIDDHIYLAAPLSVDEGYYL